MKKLYAFTKKDVNLFLGTVLHNTFEAIDNGEDVPGIEIKVGNEKILIPMFAEQYEELSDYLKRAIETEEEL